MDKNNSIENAVDAEDIDSSKGDRRRVSYVAKSHTSMIDFLAAVYKTLGHADYHSNKEIASINRLSPSSIKPHLASCQQYGLLELKHGTGYKITDLFTRIYLPVNDAEQIAAVVESLKSVEIYQGLFKQYEYHIVPPVMGIKNHFVRNYQFKNDIAEKAAEVFIENLRDYNLLDDRGVLISGIAEKSIAHGRNTTPNNDALKDTPQPSNTPPPPTPTAIVPPPKDDGLFELPIPLPNKRRAYLRYPLDNLTKKDIKVITKALEFIASSLDDDDEMT